MEIQKATGIVLSAKGIGEADVLCSIITRSYGKRKFLFKGIKKSKKRSITVTEPGSIIDLVYYYHENKEIHIINESKIVKHQSEIRKDLQKILHLYFIVEATDKTTGFNHPDAPTFDLLAAGIETLAKSLYPLNLSCFFIIHLLRIQGILPDTSVCKSCGSRDFTTFSFDEIDLRPLCSNCRKSGIMHYRSLTNFIQMGLTTKFNAMDHKIFSSEDMLSLLFQLSLFLEHYYHTELKSKRFILDASGEFRKN